MGIAVAIIYFIIIGIIIAKLARLVGSKIFRFSDIYKFFLKCLKK